MKRLLSPATNPAGLTAAAPEAKVAAAAVIGYAVSLVLQALAAYVPHFHAPPATLVALIVTTLSGIAGWLAPHTYRPGAPAARASRASAEITVTADASQFNAALDQAIAKARQLTDAVAVLPPSVAASVQPSPGAGTAPPGILTDAERAQLAELQARAQAPPPAPSSDPRERQAQADMGGTAS